MPKLKLLVGPPGSGKSTYAQELQKDDNAAQIFRINQDEQGKDQHFHNFKAGIEDKNDIVVDRMGFNKVQRERYLKPAKEAGYETEIVVLHENKETCLKRCIDRISNEGHPTVQTKEDAQKALNFFFTHYERAQDNEADVVKRIWPVPIIPLNAIICDIDGTMANIDHRLHFVRGEGKKDWKNFLLPQNIEQDKLNEWCRLITNNLRHGNIIVMCSGRTDNVREVTREWLGRNKIFYDYLFMRPRDDHRQDYVVKEILLDFEILTRFTPLFFIDDRKQVVDMYRQRGYTVLQCNEGNF